MTTETTTLADKAKIAAGAGLAALGIYGYYWLAEMPIVVRILTVVAGFVAGGAVAWLSAPGKQFSHFAGDAVTEVKKVVWPTRKETMQTVAAVFAFVVVMAIFLWLTDKTLEWILYDLLLGWRRA
jgi:preprotein translocase subunit SecE